MADPVAPGRCRIVDAVDAARWRTLIESDPAAYLTLGDLHRPHTMLALFGLAFTAILMAARVRGGMAVAFLAALQGFNKPAEVVIIVATIAGLCIGMAFRKSFKAPVA